MPGKTRRTPAIEQASPLLTWLASQMGPDDLFAIAASDFGTQEDLRTRLARLKRICHGDLSVLRPLEFDPGEVLALTRWYEPSPSERPRHLRRLFACVVLLLAALEPINAADSIVDSLVLAIDSVLVAFPEQRSALLALVDTLSRDHDWARHQEAAFLELARVILLSAGGASPDVVIDALGRAAALASAEREPLWESQSTHRCAWLLGITPYNQKAATWRRLFDAVVEGARGDSSKAELVERLLDFGTTWSGEMP